MSTVVRVLPWRRQAAASAEELGPILTEMRKRWPKANVARVQRAFEVAGEAHRDQFRQSGEAYINHPLAVAKIAAELGGDETTIIAALLHDAVEDSELTVAEVGDAFDARVALIVDGVTKLERIQFDSKEAQQAATMRKMLVAIAEDPRVLFIKLADRLHNMRTLGATPPEKQQRIAAETRDIYAPLAHRLGMDELRQQLEDLSFAALHPRRYAELDHLVSLRTAGREAILSTIVAAVRTKLAEVKLTAEVTGRSKHLWSIYDKMQSKGRAFDDIFDVLAVRVIVPTEDDCYAALGQIHRDWHPIPGRFKDYIATPKFNNYQSLHTTVFGPDGKAVEVQIRTQEMHRNAAWGIAQHFKYKHRDQVELDWLSRIIDWQADAEPDQFMDLLRQDLAVDELKVLTPAGKAIGLPVGATAVDFAYAVHTNVGHGAVGARVNGRLVPLNHQLGAGDTCEIITSKVAAAGPKAEWLEFVATPKARNKIRQYVARGRREGAATAGLEALGEELGLLGVPTESALASDLFAAEGVAHTYADRDAFLRAIGDGHIAVRPLALRLARALHTAAGGLDEPIADEPRVGMRRVELEVRALDRRFLLRDVTNVLSEGMVNIVSSSTVTEGASATMRFGFFIAEGGHLDDLHRRLFNLEGITEVSRVA